MREKIEGMILDFLVENVVWSSPDYTKEEVAKILADKITSYVSDEI
jgi:hypothetical protein